MRSSILVLVWFNAVLCLSCGVENAPRAGTEVTQGTPAPAQDVPRGTLAQDPVSTAIATVGSTPMEATGCGSANSSAYRFPFEAGRKVLVSQGPYGGFSHRTANAYDLTAPQGTPILAVKGGVITKAIGRYDVGSQPNMIVVKQDDGQTGMYLHMMKDGVYVKEGDTIKVGDKIGAVGTTGFSTGPHLHYELVRSSNGMSFCTTNVPEGETLRTGSSYSAKDTP